MNNIESKIHSINEEITCRYSSIEDLGVLKGLAGLALFNFNYSKIFNVDNKTGNLILEESIHRINKGYTNPTYCNGILGLGWVINYLIKENFIDSSNNETLIDIDRYAHYWLAESLKQNNFDFLHGAIGYANYLIDRYNNLRNCIDKKLIEESIFILLKYFTDLLPNIISFSNDSKEVSIKMSFENKVIFGLAHGISSIIYILNKTSTISKFTVESLEAAHQYSLYLIKYKNKEYNGISLFPNYLSSDGIVKYYSGLSWCTGDLGIGYNLLNTSIQFNHNEIYELLGIEILKHGIERKSLEKSLLKENNICHGSLGAYKIFSNSYKITKDEDFNKAAAYWLNLGLQNIDIKNDSDLTILNGLSGIGLTLLEVCDSRKLNWDECLFL